MEKFFKCPYCWERISILVDTSVDDTQISIEDCEVCCRPIQFSIETANGELVSFSATQS